MTLPAKHVVFIVLCGLIMFLSLGQRHSFGLFMVPVTTDWGGAARHSPMPLHFRTSSGVWHNCSAGCWLTRSVPAE